MRLPAAQSQLVVIDFQERLFAAMPEDHRQHARKAAENLVWLAGELGMPVLVTEQYPQGLGHTLSSIAAGPALEKLTFSAMGEPGSATRIERPQLIVCGMETHICVALTVRDLRQQGVSVVVVPDACLSRRTADWRHGLDWMRQMGAEVVPHETVMFGLLGRAGTPAFKEASRRIR